MYLVNFVHLGFLNILKKGKKKKNVRLNLFNYVLALFCAKFACNLAIRYIVFRWELCKGSV